MADDVRWTSMNILNLSSRGLTRIEVVPDIQPIAAIFDKNQINRIENLEFYQQLQQLSLSDNRLSHIHGLSHSVNLTVLNLPNNRITAISGLKDLTRLTWLNLSGNKLKTIEQLDQNVLLEHLDLSDNVLTHLGNLAMLSQLKTLLLHGNNINTLKPASQFLPQSLGILSLAENSLVDLNEVCHLSGLHHLEQLSVMNNPCVMMTGLLPAFDYRPFVVNWCMDLRILDGYIVTEKEGLKAEWLYSQGKGRHYKPGQHVQLIQYLAQTCPHTHSAKESVDEDLKLHHILEQQRIHQLEVEQEEHLQQQQQQFLPFQNYATGDHQSLDLIAADMSSVQGPLDMDHFTRAWQSRPGDQVARPSTAPSQRVNDRGQRSDAQLRDNSSQGKRKCKKETTSMLEAESRYLPTPSEMVMSPLRPFSLDFTAKRPSTAPPAGDAEGKDGEPPPRSSVADIYSQHRSPSSNHSSNSSFISKYDQLENRQIKPKQTIMSGFTSSPKLSPKAGSVGMNPTPSDSQPQAFTKKRSQSPVMRAINFTPTATEESDSDAKSQTSSQLKKLKSMLTKGNNNGRSPSSKPVRPVDHGSPSAGSSSYKAQYSPDKYTTPTRKSLLSQQQQRQSGETRTEERQGDSEYKAKESAAIRIQCLWRGYYARNYFPQVLHVRQELRSRRADDHIRILKAETERQRQMYEQEKQLRGVQLDALKYLWKQVKSLQSWKAEILQSMDTGSGQVLTGSGQVGSEATDAGHRSSTSVQTSQDFLDRSMKEMLLTSQRANLTAEEGFSLTPRVSANSPHTTLVNALYAPSSSQPDQPAKEQHLESVCKSLQEQVHELQDVLKSMSNYVFQGGIISADKEQTGDDPVRLSLSFEQHNNSNIPASSKSTHPSSSADPSGPVQSQQPPPSPTSRHASLHPSAFSKSSPSSNHSSANSSPRAGSSSKSSTSTLPPTGIPTAPWGLKLQQHGQASVILQWQPSVLLKASSRLPLIGYRIYVNGTAKGMVAGTQTRALLEGLMNKINYRITVKAVSALGESADSNVVILHGESDTFSESSQSHHRDDSDRDPSEDGKSGGGGPDHSGGPPPGGGSSSRDRRRHNSSGSSPGRGSRGSSGGREPKDSPQTSTPKTKQALHVQFDTRSGLSPDSGYIPSPTHSSASSKDKYSRTFPPSPQSGDQNQPIEVPGSPKSRDKKEKRVSVSDRLKSSSIDCMESHDSVNVYSTSPKEGFKKLEHAMERGQVSKEDFIKFALEKGIFSKDEIKKMASKMHKRKSSIDVPTTPLKAFSSEDMVLGNDDAKKDNASSKIPIYLGKGKQFDSSSESIDIPQEREKSRHRKDVSRSDSMSSVGKVSVNRSSSDRRKKDSLGSAEKRKHLDSSGSESCSPQVSPCNTSSGMSLGGTTGSESGSDHGRKHSHGTPPSGHHESLPTQRAARRNSPGHGRDSSAETAESFAAARKISLTKPNPPPIAPPKDKLVSSGQSESESLTLGSQSDTETLVEPISIVNEEIDVQPQKAHSKSEQSRDSYTSNKSKRSSLARISNDTFVISPSQLDELHKSSSDYLNRTPPRLFNSSRGSDKSPQSTKESHGYTPSFFQEDSPSSSRKIFLRRERSFGQMSDPGDSLQDRNSGNLHKVLTDPNIVTDENEQVQEIVQSDGSVTFASYRKVSLDRGSDGDLESLEGSQTLSIPGVTIEDTHSKPPSTPELLRKKRETTVIDSDDNMDENQEEMFQRSRRGRSSQRSTRRKSKERNKKERRSSSLSSVASVMRKLSIKREKDREKERLKDVVTNKPPKPPTPPTGRSPVREEVERKRNHHHKTDRRRSKSETCMSDSDDPNQSSSSNKQRPPRPRSRSSDRSPRRRSSERGSRGGKLASASEGSSEGEMSNTRPTTQGKHFLKHKRSGSDLAILPDRPESPATSPRKPAPPSTPKQGMSSPRIKRSSSFSKGVTGSSSGSKSIHQSNVSGSTSVRQCISQETLKAVKSKSQEMMNRAGTQHDPNETDLRVSDLEDESDSNSPSPSATTTNVRRSVSSEVINDPSGLENEAEEDDLISNSTKYSSALRRSGSLRDDRLLYMSKYKNEFSGGEFKQTVGDNRGKGPGYSPKLKGRSPVDDTDSSKGQRRIKLGTKAADIFAKFHMKLSERKSSDKPT